ncbi:WD40 repeat domain-containing protein [Vairimorpha necatrix]|uniref:WD40 repeat domain-containing protein n=1 Tax=Vairimorpha necatrix TaxID=6039 RepID=A0AAX4JA25_9MICR
MENYYLLNYKIKQVTGDLYSNNGSIMIRKDNQIIVDDSIYLKDEYSEISHFLNYQYEFVLVENKKTIFLINKHNLNKSELGSFTDEIVEATSNNKYTLVVTKKSVILFSNEYFDIIGETNLETEICKAILSSDDVFVLIYENKVEFYNLKMEKISECKMKCLSGCYIERYNYWALVTEREIIFIEDNGCIFNRIPLIKEILQGNLYNLKCESFENKLILATGNLITLLVLVDGHWRVKFITELEGEFVSFYDRKVYSKKNDTLFYYFINKEYSKIGNMFLVSDYKDLLVYNFDKKKLAEHDFKLEFKEDIKRILVDRDEFGIIFSKRLLVFDKEFEIIRREENKFKHNICLKNTQIINEDKLIFKKKDIKILSIENSKIESSNIHNSKHKKPIKRLNDILNIHNINGKIITINTNGEIYSEENKLIFKSKPITSEYTIDYKNGKIYLLYQNTLIYDDVILDNITSFYVSDSLLYTKHDKLYLYNTFTFTDTDFKLLGTTDLEIYGISRFNSIDTYYNKEHIKKQIEKYFKNEEYSKSIEMMIKHNIKINMENINIEKMKDLNYKYIIYIIDEVIQDYDLVLDDEFVYIINKFATNKYEFTSRWTNHQILRNSTNNISDRSNTYNISDTNNIIKILYNYIKNNTIQDKSKIQIFIDDLFVAFNNNSDILDYIFMKCSRIDLCFLYTRNLERCIKLIKNNISLEEIKKNIVLYYGKIQDISKIEEICHFINEDVYILEELQTDYHKILEYYKLFDELIYYLIINKLQDELERVIKKYDLYDKLLVYIIILNNQYSERINLVELYVKGSDVKKKIWIYEYLQEWDKLLEVYLENDMYHEIFNFKYISTSNYKDKILRNLEDRNKFKDLGIIYEIYLDDPERSLKYFVLSRSTRDIYRLWKILKVNFDLLDLCVTHYRALENNKRKLDKYKKRLNNIQHDIEDDTFSVTSVCKTNRGIPGNLYEYEFYLEKINDILVELVKWTEETKMILEMSNNKELRGLLDNLKEEVKNIPELYKVGYERSKELIMCVDITAIIGN